MAGKNVAEFFAALKFLERLPLTTNFIEGEAQDLCFDPARYHDDTVGIAEQQVAGTHGNSGAFDRHVNSHDFAAPF